MKKCMSVMVRLNEGDLITLRQLASECGFVHEVGPDAGTGLGNLSGLLRAIANEYRLRGSMNLFNEEKVVMENSVRPSWVPETNVRT